MQRNKASQETEHGLLLLTPVELLREGVSFQAGLPLWWLFDPPETSLYPENGLCLAGT